MVAQAGPIYLRGIQAVAVAVRVLQAVLVVEALFQELVGQV
jgi:hypothetical protein